MGMPTDDVSAASAEELEGYRQVQRALWDSGEFDNVAKRMIWEEGAIAVDAAEIEAGEDVLDVACGSGNAAIRAAERGARVTGVDIAPDLVETARANASSAGVELEAVEGDAAELPFPDDSFDVVVSVFGVQFAPRQRDCATEIARVLRPGGRFALINWTPEGFIGQNLKLISSRLPKPPGFVQPPPLWGVPDHLEQLFAGTGFEVSGRPQSVRFSFDSGADYVDYMARYYGPFVTASAKLGEEWSGVRDDLIELCDRLSVEPGRCEVDSEYLLARGTRGTA